MSSYDDLLAIMKQRRSVRKFSERAVDVATLEKVIEAATQAPSASNRQDWQFTVVLSEEVKQSLASLVKKRWEEILNTTDSEMIKNELSRYAKNFDWFSHASAVVIVSSKRPEGFLCSLLGDDALTVSGAYASAAMATQNLLLAAESEGLASCCLTGPLAAGDEIREEVGLGRNRNLVCLVALGYASAPAEPVSRKTIDKVMRIIE